MCLWKILEAWMTLLMIWYAAFIHSQGKCIECCMTCSNVLQKRNVITPMLQPQHFRTSLLRQKRGVLLYGPPGTGKTMLAKALAKECTACFIVIKASTILSKWYGETNKMISAIWTVAYKLQPTILFIDEVDALLGS